MLVHGLVAYQFNTSSSLTASSTGWTNITNTKSEITKTYSASSNGTYYFYVKDASGNINKKSVAITKIDKTKPTITTPTASGITDGSLTINTTFNDANSGLSKIVVYYKTSSSSTYTSKTTTYTTMNGGTTGATGSQSKSITISNLASGTTYNIYVVGYDVAGNSVQSSTITTNTKKYVAQIGSTKYETLAAAINAAGTSATTILMLDNTQESVTIPSTKSITLNLSGKTVTGNMTNQGKLTLTGGGKIAANSGNVIVNSGNLTLSGSTIDGYNATIAVVNTSGTFNMSSGTISGGNYALQVSGGSANTTGGTITSKVGGTATTVWVLQSGKIELKNTTVTNTGGGVAVTNQTGNGANFIIRNRSANYGISGRPDGYIIATTNTGPGQASENVTIYQANSQKVLFPTWTEYNGQDDIDWMRAESSNVLVHTVTIYKSSHNNETGNYNVHIYSSFNNWTANGFIGNVTLQF